jgi:ribonuclease-3
MSLAPANPYRELERRLGYRFRDRELLVSALTHSSARAEGLRPSDNERLEFLGDRVLGLAVAQMLLEAFPGAKEGDLARRFNALVRKQTCAEVAREIGLGQFLVLSAGEADSGGREKDTILGDACEAVLGAIFLDGGFLKARTVILRYWKPDRQSERQAQRDPKTMLQEWAQGRGHPLPRYTELQREGPHHAPRFTAEVRIPQVASASGTGPSKRAAEQDAARRLLASQGIMVDSDES